VKLFHYNPDKPYRDHPDLYVNHWGKEDCAPRHSFGPGIRDVHKFHFIHRGRGIVRVAGHTYELSAGEAFLIYPNVVIYYEADEADPWTYSYCAFYGGRVEELLSRTRLTPERPVFPMDLQVMPSLIEQLSDALKHGRNRDLRLNALSYRFMAALVEAAPIQPGGQNHSRKHHAYIHQAMEFMHAHYSEPISIAQLASDLGLDRKYLSAIFKEATGVPPQRYLMEYRMRKACGLLRGSGFSVGEIARSVGYEDALLFSKMFRRYAGVSPSEFRSGDYDIPDIIP
jgi:AraC-like DNA-binding protein